MLYFSYIIKINMNTPKELMQEMRNTTMLRLENAEKELFDIIKPINVTKLNYTEKAKFVCDGGFTKAWEEIKKIVESHQWLKENEI